MEHPAGRSWKVIEADLALNTCPHKVLHEAGVPLRYLLKTLHPKIWQQQRDWNSKRIGANAESGMHLPNFVGASVQADESFWMTLLFQITLLRLALDALHDFVLFWDSELKLDNQSQKPDLSMKRRQAQSDANQISTRTNYVTRLPQLMQKQWLWGRNNASVSCGWSSKPVILKQALGLLNSKTSKTCHIEAGGGTNSKTSKTCHIEAGSGTRQQTT